MRVLIVSQYYAPEPIPKPSDLAVALRERGHEVTVLTGLPQYGRGRLYPGYRLRPWMREQRDGIGLLRVFILPYHGRNVLRRGLTFLSVTLSAVLAAPFLGKADVIYAWHPPITVGFMAVAASAATGAPIVYDVQDIWPDAIVEAGLLRDGWLVRVLERVERFIYSRAQHLLVTSEAARQTLVRKGVPAAKVSAMLHWVSDALTAQASDEVRAETRAAHGWSEAFVAMFAGNFGVAQGLDTIVRAAPLLRDPRVRIVFVGQGTDGACLMQLTADLNMTGRVTFVPAVPAEQMPPLLAAADALLVHLGVSAASETVVPTKTIAYLAAGRPIVMAARGVAADLIASSGAGVALEPDRPADLAAVLDTLASMPHAERARMAEQGRAYFEAHHASGPIISSYEAALTAAAAQR